MKRLEHFVNEKLKVSPSTTSDTTLKDQTYKLINVTSGYKDAYEIDDFFKGELNTTQLIKDTLSLEDTTNNVVIVDNRILRTMLRKKVWSRLNTIILHEKSWDDVVIKIDSYLKNGASCYVDETSSYPRVFIRDKYKNLALTFRYGNNYTRNY
jgi:hypothetical protein